jgi:hypothetical protein
MMKPAVSYLVLVLGLAAGTSSAQPWGCYDPKPGHPTGTEKTQYIKLVSALAIEAEHKHGVPAAAIAAMAIAESGYGWTRTALEANNLFGWKYNSPGAAAGRGSYVLTCQPAEDINNQYVKFKDAADAVDFVAGKLAVLPAYKVDTRKYQTARTAGDTAIHASREWIAGIAEPYNWKPETYTRTIIRIMNNAESPSDTVSDTHDLYRLSESAGTPRPESGNSASSQIDPFTLAKSFFASKLAGQVSGCEPAINDFPGWSGYPVRRCKYEESGVVVRTYMLNPTAEQLSHWTLTACADAGAKDTPGCLTAVAKQILSASSGVFPVAGYVPEPASSADGKGDRIICLLFRDGVTVHTSAAPKSPPAVAKQCPSFNMNEKPARAEKFARVASTRRDDYRANGGIEPVGSEENGDLRWLDVVHTLYQKAWGSERNELISAKAKAMRAQHLFE